MKNSTVTSRKLVVTAMLEQISDLPYPPQIQQWKIEKTVREFIELLFRQIHEVDEMAPELQDIGVHLITLHGTSGATVRGSFTYKGKEFTLS